MTLKWIFDTLRKIGNRLGTGAIMVFDQKTCLVGATVNLIEFFARESCGWCTPCREGLPFILDLLKRIENGDGEPAHIPMLEQHGQITLECLLRLCPRGCRTR